MVSTFIGKVIGYTLCVALLVGVGALAMYLSYCAVVLLYCLLALVFA